MLEQGLASLSEVVERLQADRSPAFQQKIIEAMTTNETSWFRDAFPFDTLKSRILPELGIARGSRPVRVWSAACSSGQEPYAVGMAAAELLSVNPEDLPGDVEIVATDISGSMLEQGRAARYDEKEMARGLSEARKQRFFSRQGDCWEVKSEIRRRVTFRHLNLLEEFNSLGRFDVIFCRNVLIYFSGGAIRDVLSRFAHSLNPGGYLVLGACESLAGYSDAFEVVRGHAGEIYRLKKR